jgi:hypothetical protein
MSDNAQSLRPVACLLALALLAPDLAADPSVNELSLEETQARLTSQVLEQWQVAATDIRVTEAEARTWPDASLGCPGRRRLAKSPPVPGFRFVLVLREQRFTYHADTHGRILRCDLPAKPLDPIAQ